MRGVAGVSRLRNSGQARGRGGGIVQMKIRGTLTLVKTLYSQLSTCCWTGIVEVMPGDASRSGQRGWRLEELQVNDGCTHDDWTD